MRLINDSQTDRALAAFDAFLVDWIPAAAHQHVFGHRGNDAEHVRNAIRGIADQRTLPLREPPFGYAVFSMEAIYSNRDYRNGILYTPASPVFENPVQGENSLQGFRRRRGDNHILGEISEYRVSR